MNMVIKIQINKTAKTIMIQEIQTKTTATATIAIQEIANSFVF